MSSVLRPGSYCGRSCRRRRRGADVDRQPGESASGRGPADEQHHGGVPDEQAERADDRGQPARRQKLIARLERRAAPAALRPRPGARPRLPAATARSSRASAPTASTPSSTAAPPGRTVAARRLLRQRRCARLRRRPGDRIRPKLVGGTFTYPWGARLLREPRELSPGRGQRQPGARADHRLGAPTTTAPAGSGPVVAADGHGFTFNDKNAIWGRQEPELAVLRPRLRQLDQFRRTHRSAAARVPDSTRPTRARHGRTRNQLSPATCREGRPAGHGRSAPGPTARCTSSWEDSDNSGFKQVVAVSTTEARRSRRRARTSRPVTDIKSRIPGSNFRTDSFASVGVRPAERRRVRGVGRRTAPSSPAPIVVYRRRQAARRGRRSRRSRTDRRRLLPGSRRGAERTRRRRLAGAGRGRTRRRTGPATPKIDAYYSSSSNGGGTWIRRRSR